MRQGGTLQNPSQVSRYPQQRIFFKAKAPLMTIRTQLKMFKSPCNKFSARQRGTMRFPPWVGALQVPRWDDPLSSRLGAMSLGKNRHEVVPGQAQHHIQGKWNICTEGNIPELGTRSFFLQVCFPLNFFPWIYIAKTLIFGLPGSLIAHRLSVHSLLSANFIKLLLCSVNQGLPKSEERLSDLK